uniref:Tetraspanin-3 n=1 Tax=Petromyzon marinus TaxID=7757 RepID=S4RH37_PETMA
MGFCELASALNKNYSACVRVCEQAGGGILCYIGAYVFITYDSYRHFLEDRYVLLAPLVVVAVGIFLFVVGIVGCCATVRESKCGLSTFFILLLMIFSLEVVAALLGYAYRGQVKDKVERTISQVFNEYNGTDSNTASRAIDYVQHQLKCCGVKNYLDWKDRPWFNHTGNNSVPISCCRSNVTHCDGNIKHPGDIYNEGCEAMVEKTVKDILNYVMRVALIYALVQGYILGIKSVRVCVCVRSTYWANRWTITSQNVGGTAA